MTFDRNKYHRDYAKDKLKRIPLDVSIEKYEQIKNHTDNTNETVNGFIKRAIDETMKRDSGL